MPDHVWQKIRPSNLLIQERQAFLLAVEMEEYARSIGCTIIGDEVICHTAEQSELLAKKWKELTE